MACIESNFRPALFGVERAPIDIDKVDYLRRDSLHAGVPYGQNFDASRLLNCLTQNPETGRLAIVEKGRTAAEMMVFSRYIMFSEVYWHHTVRSATAMLQRSVFLLQHRLDLPSTLSLTDDVWIARLRQTASGSEAETLTEGLFGDQRRLYKRIAQYSHLDQRNDQQTDSNRLHRQLAQRPYWWLVAVAERVAKNLSTATGLAVHATEVLIDAPPVKLEVDINMDVVMRDQSVAKLGDVSPVASTLAYQQFDNYVKRVRVFVRDELRTPLQDCLRQGQLDELIAQSIKELEREIV